MKTKLSFVCLAIAFGSSEGVSATSAKIQQDGPQKSKTSGKASKLSSSTESSKAGLENYQDLIQKAQNLTLQRDRLQASQVLIRGIQRETRGTQAYKELTRTLDELSSVFYTEAAQNLFNLADSAEETRPKDAIDQYQEALQKEERNVAILKALARVQLRLADCSKADAFVTQAEDVNPYSAEVVLLRAQTLSCQQNFEALVAKLEASSVDLEPVDKFVQGLKIAQAVRDKDLKKAKTLVLAWENQNSDYPEVYYWKWKISQESKSTDRASGSKYTQLCQGLTARKRKSLSLDVDLCRGKDAVESDLRANQVYSPAQSQESRS